MSHSHEAPDRDEDALGLCLAQGQRRQYPRNAAIISAGADSNSLFFIVTGSVSVMMEDPEGHEIVLAYLHEGDVFGEIGLFDERHRRSAWVRAREPSEVVQLSYERLEQLCQQRPEVLFALLAQLARRIRRTNRQLGDLVFRDVRGRVARALMDLRKEPEARSGEDGVRIRVTRRELGRLVGCSREMASRVLHTMEESGAIVVDGRDIIVPH